MKSLTSGLGISPALFAVLFIAAASSTAIAQPAFEADQERIPPVLLNQAEVAKKLNDVVLDRVRGLELEADGEVKVVVDEDGRPVRHWLTVETGYEALDRAIGEVVAVMRFQPANEAGKPVSCVAVIPIAFRPEGADVQVNAR